MGHDQNTFSITYSGYNSIFPKFSDTLLAIISEQWPELRHGRIVTGMIATLHKRNLLAVLEAKAGFMIVPQQMVSQGQAATLEQQFGASGDDLTFLEHLDVLRPSMLGELPSRIP